VCGEYFDKEEHENGGKCTLKSFIIFAVIDFLDAVRRPVFKQPYIMFGLCILYCNYL
jgi:hypothetical protein